MVVLGIPINSQMGWAGLGAVSQPVLGLDADEKGVGISYTLGGI